VNRIRRDALFGKSIGICTSYSDLLEKVFNESKMINKIEINLDKAKEGIAE